MRRSRLVRVLGVALFGTLAQVGCSLQGAGDEVATILRENTISVAGDIAQAVAVTLVENRIN